MNFPAVCAPADVLKVRKVVSTAIRTDKRPLLYIESSYECSVQSVYCARTQRIDTPRRPESFISRMAASLGQATTDDHIDILST